MEGLKVKSGATTLFLTPGGNVAKEKDGAETVVGKWRSESKGNEVKNQLRYNVDGVEQAALPVKYSFNDFNQLVAVVPGEGGADGDPFVFRGRIRINDNHDVVYDVFEKDGTQTANRVTVYGDISFAEKTNDLVITLAGDGECVIKGTKGTNGISLMKAEKNFVAEFQAADLLRFMAITSNDFSNSPLRVPKKAVIEFVGKWDMKESDGENQLVFVSKIISSGGNKSVALGFAGQVKAVSFGFAYFADKSGHNLAFNIKGEHKWKSKEAKWELSMGFSERKFSVEFSGAITSNGKFGQFVMKGAAKIEHEAGKKTLLTMELEGVYTFQDKRIAFKIDIQTGEGKITYDLLFEGKFVFKGGVLTFQVKFSNKNPNSDFALEVAWKKDSEQLKMALSVVLEKDKKDIKLTFEFELRMTWKDGVLVKNSAKPLAA